MDAYNKIRPAHLTLAAGLHISTPSYKRTPERSEIGRALRCLQLGVRFLGVAVQPKAKSTKSRPYRLHKKRISETTFGLMLVHWLCFDSLFAHSSICINDFYFET